jgi:hypothetical protein
MKKSLLALLLLLSFPQSSFPALRCGRLLVNVGDHQMDVLQKCGNPAMTEQRTRVVGEELHHPGRTLDIEKYEEVIIDEWIYNFGPRHLKQYLRFENGILKEIRNLGYGY